MQIRSIISLTALESFRCIGADCPQSCCRNNWRIPVDDATFTAWAALPDQEECDRLTQSVDTVGSDAANERRVLRRNTNGECAHLTADGLCGVQQRHDHALLPETCRNYPRFHGESALYSVHSAALSCPEIARLVIAAGTEVPVWAISSQRREQDNPIEYWLSRQLALACRSTGRRSRRACTHSARRWSGSNSLPNRAGSTTRPLRRACWNPSERVRGRGPVDGRRPAEAAGR